MFEKDLEVPRKEPVDYVHTAVKTIIASIQNWWAAPAAEIFPLVFALFGIVFFGVFFPQNMGPPARRRAHGRAHPRRPRTDNGYLIAFRHVAARGTPSSARII